VTTHAFVDESIRRRTYMVASAVLQPRALASARTLMRDLRQRGQRRLHSSTESDDRRRAILSRLVTCPARVRIYVSNQAEASARHLCMSQLVTDSAEAGVTRVVIESREGRDQADKHTIYTTLKGLQVGATLTYEHLRGHEEPLLWIPDAVAWAYGAGGDWPRRVEPLLDGIVNVDS
jgi:hypothetical protein